MLLQDTRARTNLWLVIVWPRRLHVSARFVFSIFVTITARHDRMHYISWDCPQNKNSIITIIEQCGEHRSTPNDSPQRTTNRLDGGIMEDRTLVKQRALFWRIHYLKFTKNSYEIFHRVVSKKTVISTERNMFLFPAIAGIPPERKLEHCATWVVHWTRGKQGLCAGIETQSPACPVV